MVVGEMKTDKEIVKSLWKQIKYIIFNKLEKIKAEVVYYQNMLYAGLIKVMKNGRNIKSVSEVEINDDLIIKFNDGIIKSKVIDKNGQKK
jgi:ribosomal 50S subunit-recycling heat shock protein